MIRVVTLDSFEDKPLAKLCQTLYAAFAVGCEHSAELKTPAGMSAPLDAQKLLDTVDSVRAYPDDKLLYLTSRKLKERTLPSGTAPTFGFAVYGMDKAIVSTDGTKGLEDGLKLIARHSLHQLGHCWELHHCLDPRCAMYPPWTPSFAAGESTFCTFCRDKSEQKIRLAKS